MSKLSDNIWFTRKARIQTSERLLSNNHHSQILLVYYSLFNTCISVIVIKNISIFGKNTDLALVIMSIIILVTSLFVANKNFKGRALSLKAHYIELQRLYFKTIDAEESKQDLTELREDYIKLLELEENHKSIDDLIFRVFNENSIETRKPTKQEKKRAYLYKIVRLLLLAVLYIFPFIVIYTTSLI